MLEILEFIVDYLNATATFSNHEAMFFGKMAGSVSRIVHFTTINILLIYIISISRAS